ncbi:MAG TPA: hypothetical protein VHB51_02050 [Candidatus Saccharimonadales bacterium]|nr:hypothetical protein [Candidatus Saccharimonadales bacterium]
MQALNPALRFEKDCELSQLYALSILHDFHALRFPDQYQNNPILGVAPTDIDDLAFKSSPCGPGEQFEKPELALIAPGRTANAAAGKIMDPARPVLEFLSRTYQGEDIAKMLQNYCQWQKRRYYKKGTEDLLAGNDGQRLQARDILPPAEIIRAMHNAWNVRNIRRCFPLEKFIARLLAAGQTD